MTLLDHRTAQVEMEERLPLSREEHEERTLLLRRLEGLRRLVRDVVDEVDDLATMLVEENR